jgi:hypothetical protein
MGNTKRNLLIFFAPILLMIMVNESAWLIQGKSNHYYGKQPTINSANQIKDKCTWECHDNTAYCKHNHVKLVKGVVSYTDIIYNKTIQLLQSSNRSYAMDNLIYLVFGMPLFIYFLLIKCIDNYYQIKKMKKLK